MSEIYMIRRGDTDLSITDIELSQELKLEEKQEIVSKLTAKISGGK